MKLNIKTNENKIGFTLAEVLITLGIIGIVAAMTLPAVTTKVQYKEFETQFKVAENLIHNAVNYMHANGREIYGETYCTANSSGIPTVVDCTNLEIFSEVLAEAFNGIRALNKYDSNWSTTGHKYKTYSNSGEFKASLLDDGYMELINGMSIMIESGATSTLPIISIDINGPYKKPNRFGYDTFSFVIDKGDRVCPLGSPTCKSSSYSKNPENYCSNTSTESNNGFTCGYFASTNKDYFNNLK